MRPLNLLLSVVLVTIIATNPLPALQHASSIHSFTAETSPGIRTEMVLSWSYNGPQTDDLMFHIFQMDQDSAMIPLGIEQDTVRSFKAMISPIQKDPVYVIEARTTRAIIDKVYTTGLTTATIGFAHKSGGDAPYDGGKHSEIKWELEVSDAGVVKIYRNMHGEGKWNYIATVPAMDKEFIDNGLEDGKAYNYLLRAYGEKQIYESGPIMNVITHAAWFDMRKINLLIIALVVLAAVIFYVMQTHKTYTIRRIAGLEAIEEAVGRATEMGRSVLFIPGIQDLDDVQTLAGLNILGKVARYTAEYETGLNVPVSRSLVMSNGREVVKEAYLSVGRPDFYHDDMVHYVTDEQFGYVAAVDGIMVREEPAACFYMGAFFAESLILAETGNSIGAIQVAGTAMPSQLPFFVAACDYTLIGEELFAASAYLSGDKRMIASLRGQDVGKALSMLSIAVGSILATFAVFTNGQGFFGKLSDAFIRLFALNF